MSDSSVKEFRELFIKLANKNIKSVRKILKGLRETGYSQKEMDLLVRNVHTLKGQSLILGYKKMGSICGKLENLLRDLSEGQKKITGEQVTSLEMIFKGLAESVREIKESGKESVLDDENKELKNLTR